MLDPHIYIGHMEAYFGVLDNTWLWHAPGPQYDCIGMLRMQSIPQRSIMPEQGASVEGLNIFVYPGPRNYPELLLDLGDIEARTSLVQRSFIETKMLDGAKLATTGVLEIIRELMIDHADPTGQTRWKPLRTGRWDGLKLYLGGCGIDGFVLREKFSPSHPAVATTLAVFEADYRRNVSAGMLEQALRRWTASEQIKIYGRWGADLDGIIPLEYRSIGSEEPHSTFSDTFDGSGGDISVHTPDPINWGSWSEPFGDINIVNNQAEGIANALSRARADNDLSSDAHSAIVQVTALSAGVHAGTCVRYEPPSADTLYLSVMREGIDHRIFEVTAGSLAVLVDVDTVPPSVPFQIETKVDSANLITAITTAQTITITDPTLTGNLRTGIMGFDGTRLNNFVAATLAAPSGLSIPIAAHHYRQMQGVN